MTNARRIVTLAVMFDREVATLGVIDRIEGEAVEYEVIPL